MFPVGKAAPAYRFRHPLTAVSTGRILGLGYFPKALPQRGRGEHRGDLVKRNGSNTKFVTFSNVRAVQHYSA
jgi:hypothetical protein